MRLSVREDTPLPKTKKDFQKFLRNDQNKTELFEMLTEVLFENWTKGIKCIVQHLSTNKADGIVHSSLKRVTIVCADTDVVIALNASYDMSITELWIGFGSGKNCGWIPI